MQTILKVGIDNAGIITFDINLDVLITRNQTERDLILAKLAKLQYQILQLDDELANMSQQELQDLQIKLLTNDLETDINEN